MSQNTSQYPVPAVFADPATTEAYIIEAGIHSRERLTAVMSRPHKGPELITLLIDDAAMGRLPYSLLSDATLAKHLLLLLALPAVTAQHLRTLAEVAVQGLPPAAELLAALCVHPLADSKTVITALWYASGRTQQNVALVTGQLLPAALNWVSREVDRVQGGHHDWQISHGQRRRVMEAERRWADWAGADRAMTSFLVTSSFTFTDEADLFAAGRAISASPTFTSSREP